MPIYPLSQYMRRFNFRANRWNMQYVPLEAIEHFMQVNQCSRDVYSTHRKAAFDVWRERNRFEWTTDLGTYVHLITQQAE